MANAEQLEILKQGVEAWNKWREDHPLVRPKLSEADLRGSKLTGVDLKNANLSGANLYAADLSRADLRNADLNRADFGRAHLSMADFSGADLGAAYIAEAYLTTAKFIEANLSGANLSSASLQAANFSKADLSDTYLYRAKLIEANLSGANLSGADLSRADLRNADLSGANLSLTHLIETNFEQADISNCHIFGVSVWNIKTQNLTQSDLVITDGDEPEITVDNIEVAQFVYLLLHNEKIRDVINTIGRKAVLILGRFALPERKAILEAMRNKLREKGYLPIVFDFEKSAERDFTETIQVLAGMCLFVIADITNPKSSPLELQATVPNYMIPFAPIIKAGEHPFAMFQDLKNKYPWMMKVRTYQDEADLVTHFEKGIINPALKKHHKLLILKNKDLEMLSIGDDDEDEA